MPALRILIVDDDAVDRLAIRRTLRAARIDADVDECGDSAAAFAALGTAAYDCVILDHNLPGTNGLDTLLAIRDLGVRVPVVSLTGQGDEDLAVSLMKAGAADYLNKNGLTPERLERSLRYALALHRSEEARRDLLEREQHARQQAQSANRAKDEFLATLSHELRTPLNAMLGWTALLAGGQLGPEGTTRAIEIIDRNARVQAQLIEDLLDVSRIVSGKLRLELQVVPLRPVAEAALESVRHAAEARRVALEASFGEDRPVACDPARIQQVIWNILSNAIKFTPAGGTITLTTAPRDDRAIVTVADTGAGISGDFLPYVFDRFRQQDGAITREQGGLGIGLSLVRHLVEAHGGRVTAHSEGSGTGATFTVDLPVAAPAAAEALAPELEVADRLRDAET